MRLCFLGFAASLLLLALSNVGCGGGMQEGMATDLTESQENIRLNKEVGEMNRMYPPEGKMQKK